MMNLLRAQESFATIAPFGVSPEDEQLLIGLERYQRVAETMGFKNPKWSPSSLQALATMPKAKKEMIVRQFQLWMSWVDECHLLRGEVDDFSLLERSLRHYDLEMDDRMRETIDRDTVVEVYSEEMFQIFRSVSMLSMTGYSLLDLCAHEWFVLWERSQLTIKQMYDDVQRIMQTESPFSLSTVTPHIVIESYNTGLTEPFVPRSSYVRFQHIGFLKRKSANAPRAFICTAKGALITENSSELAQIAFL